MEIPAEVIAVLRAQIAALAKVLPKHRARLLAISLDVQRDLESQLKALSPGRFTTQETRVKLLQVRAIVDLLGAELGQRVGQELEDLGRVAARIGRDGLIDQIGAWADEFEGSVRRIASAELAGGLLDEGLLEYYETSRQTYGMEAIAKMRGELARSVLAGETLTQTTEKLSAAVEIPDWRAERIVRTEQAFAAHRRQIEDAKALDLGLVKQLVTTFDDRTGEDSVFVNGQTRELDEPFSDNIGHVYQHPPNRPNDREVVVFVPNTLNELGPPAEDATGFEGLEPVRQEADTTKPVFPPDPNRKPWGKKTRDRKKDTVEQRRSNERENEAALVLSRHGFDVEQNPDAPSHKNPDFRINGRDYWDCYSPKRATPTQAVLQIRKKLNHEQASRFVVNLGDWQGDRAALRAEFLRAKTNGVMPAEVLGIDRDGSIFHLLP